MTEELVWQNISAKDMWVLDKLILSKYLGYSCGPAGIDVPTPGYYIVRPCVNALGLGLGASKEYLECDTNHLPLGSFWCEWFEGRHYSVDFFQQQQVLCVKGIRTSDNISRWDKWIKSHEAFAFPPFLSDIAQRYSYINLEFIEDKLIEVHFRLNEDFYGSFSEFVPVWEGESTTPPEGYVYIDLPEYHGRIGAFIR